MLSFIILTQPYEVGIIRDEEPRPEMFNLAMVAQFVDIRAGI